VDLATLSGLYSDHVRALEAGYAAALAEAGFDAAVIHSGTPQKRTVYDDQFWPLRPTPELMRWVPLSEPHCFVVVEPGKKTRLVWPETHDFWEQPAKPESTHFMASLDVARTSELTLPAGKRVAWIGEDVALAEKYGLPAASANPPALAKALDALRTKKTDYEIACLAEANRRASRGHEALRRAFAGGEHAELDLHLLYLGATRQDDHEAPYKNIVAKGRNAAVLHHIAYGRDASRAQSLLVDAGATCLGYCSDVTRTWVKADGAASQTFQALVVAMEAMQKALVGRIAIGRPYEELHDESHRRVSALLIEAGIAKGSAEEIDQKGVSRVFYPHGLGHSLGLQTHDVGCALVKPRADNPFLRNTSRIEEGQVFTIEPGLYFIEPLLAELRSKPEGALVDWNAVEALSLFGGIRIEDDVVVQASGVRNLTREVLPIGGGSAATG
jgi:Xaa-Pro dipeptidase